MNNVTLMGRLTKDPEIRTAAGKKVARYTLAVNRGRDKADFIPCVAWERAADFAEKYLVKGSPVAVRGRLQTGSYEKNGQRVYTMDVVVESQEFAGPKPETPEKDGFMDVPEGIAEELPFN